jgi:hypothetical protein
VQIFDAAAEAGRYRESRGLISRRKDRQRISTVIRYPPNGSYFKSDREILQKVGMSLT